MVENRDDGETLVGWTFEVSIQRLGDVPGDRLYLLPWHVGIADQTLAGAALEKHLDKFDGTEVRARSPISAARAHAMGLRRNEIMQDPLP